MALPKGETKHKLMAVVLCDEFKYTQVSISQLMGVSPSTISTWISMGRLLIQNQNLQGELQQLRQELTRIGYSHVKELNQDIINIM
ncbi:MAG: hypothetical protein ACRCYT_02060 [Cetobacterium sp.]